MERAEPVVAATPAASHQTYDATKQVAGLNTEVMALKARGDVVEGEELCGHDSEKSDKSLRADLSLTDSLVAVSGSLVPLVKRWRCTCYVPLKGPVEIVLSKQGKVGDLAGEWRRSESGVHIEWRAIAELSGVDEHVSAWRPGVWTLARSNPFVGDRPFSDASE